MAEVMCTSPLWGARGIGPMQSTAVLLRCCLLPKYGTIVSSKNDISWGREIMNINIMFYEKKCLLSTITETKIFHDDRDKDFSQTLKFPQCYSLFT